jgi:hypothetical protein
MHNADDPDNPSPGRSHDIRRLTLFSENTGLDDRDLHRIQVPIDFAYLRRLKGKLTAFTDAGVGLTGLELYHALERCTPLLVLHAYPRSGLRNRLATGLQQSYGDHNRLLMLAVDMLSTKNVDWFMSRIAASSSITRQQIMECMDLYHGFGLSHFETVALWVASALHDYGKLYEPHFGFDAELGVALASPVIGLLVADRQRGLAEFAIRNHDAVEHLLDGEIPSGRLKKQMNALREVQRARALQFVAVMQFCGAASLGEGRISTLKIDLFKLLAMNIWPVGDGTEERLLRLLSGRQEIGVPDREQSRMVVDARSSIETEPFLSEASLYRWTKFIRDCGSSWSKAQRWELLKKIIQVWRITYVDHKHVVLVWNDTALKPCSVRLSEEDKALILPIIMDKGTPVLP